MLVETRAVPVASSAPLAPPNVMSGVVSSVLAWVGLSPFVSDTPLAPVDSPALWAVLAWARRQNQQTLIDETPTISTTPAQSSQTVDGVVTDNAAIVGAGDRRRRPRRASRPLRRLLCR